MTSPRSYSQDSGRQMSVVTYDKSRVMTQSSDLQTGCRFSGGNLGLQKGNVDQSPLNETCPPPSKQSSQLPSGRMETLVHFVLHI